MAGVTGAAMFVVAGVFAFLALILLLIAAAYGLVAAGLSPWLAFLIVAVVLLLVGACSWPSSASAGWARSGRRSARSRTTKETVAALKRARSSDA